MNTKAAICSFGNTSTDYRSNIVRICCECASRSSWRVVIGMYASATGMNPPNFLRAVGIIIHWGNAAAGPILFHHFNVSHLAAAPSHVGDLGVTARKKTSEQRYRDAARVYPC